MTSLTLGLFSAAALPPGLYRGVVTAAAEGCVLSLGLPAGESRIEVTHEL